MDREDNRDKEYMDVARHLYDSYATFQSERIISSLLSSEQGLPQRKATDTRSARQFLSDFVLRYYPNETAIKANFIDKVLLKQGSSNITIFELPVGNSRVDLCKMNDCSSAYEIKTELDTFYRLKKQLDDYFSIFENIYLIIPYRKWRSLPDYVSESCGIYTYRQKKNGSYSFKLQRAPKPSKRIDARKQLDMLPKSVIAQTFNYNQSLAKKELVELCLNEQESEEINKLFKRTLKSKYSKRWYYFKQNSTRICKIDYEWFFHNNLDPAIVY